jgi:hypothetical protein
MKRLSAVIATTGTLLAGMQAPAADWKNQSFAARRQTVIQVADCMKKRMARDRAISYNEAAKVCRDQVYRQLPGPPEGPLVAAAIPAPTAAPAK